MQYPNRFPFDVLDPAPEHCTGCSCSFAERRPQPECRYPGECDCHEEWRKDTPELLKREMWGDK